MIEEAPVRRDPIVIALAILANVTGIICLTLAIDSDPLIFGLYGVFRLTASYGLLRMKTYGLMLERVSALLWVAIPVFFVVLGFFVSHRFPPRPVVAFAVLSGIVSSWEIWYLGRSDVKARFAKRGQAGAPFPPLAKFVWFVGQLVFLSCLHVVSLPLLLKEFLNRDEAAQRRTMADMRTISIAVDARWTEEGELPVCRVHRRHRLEDQSDVPETGASARRLGQPIAIWNIEGRSESGWTRPLRHH